MLDIFFQSERHWNCSKVEFGLVSVLLAFSRSSLLFPKTLPFLIPHIFLVILAYGKCFQQWPFPGDTLLKSCLPWRTWEILLQILIEIGCYLFNIYWRDKNYVKFNTTKCYINVRFYSEMIMHCCVVNQFLEGGYLLATVWLFFIMISCISKFNCLTMPAFNCAWEISEDFLSEIFSEIFIYVSNIVYAKLLL